MADAHPRQSWRRPTWLRRIARWVIADELQHLVVDLAVANSAAVEAIEGFDALRAELVAHLQFVANRQAGSRCLEIPVYTDRQVHLLMDRLRTFTGHEYYDMEVWRCPVCPAHPLFGKVQHARVTLPAPTDETAELPVIPAQDTTEGQHAAPEDDEDGRVQVAIGGPPNRHQAEGRSGS